MSPGKHVIFSIFTLIIVLMWFETTNLDVWFQNFLYNSQNSQWLLDSPSWLTGFVFYGGTKKILILLALGLLIALVFFKNSEIIRHNHRGLRIVLLSLIIVPAVTGLIKSTSNVPCPRDITVYGGTVAYVKVFERFSDAERPAEKQECFPAVHASPGFALMSLYFLFHSRRNRRRALLFGFSVGWIMGGYKMLLGHHFLSHTLATMIMAWLLINLIVVFDTYIVHKKKGKPRERLAKPLRQSRRNPP